MMPWRGGARPDLLLLLAPCLLAALGLATARAVAIEEYGTGATAAVIRHVGYLALAVVVMAIASLLDYRLLRRFAPHLALVTLALLVLVLVLGAEQYGARRWLGIGDVTMQPSEVAKVAVVVAIAAFAAERAPVMRVSLVSLAIVGVTMALVLLEPDLGTTIVVGLAWIVLAVAWGVPWRFAGGLALLVLSLFPLAFAVAVADYQRERLAVFLDPARDPLGSGFTLRQVEVAYASGGLSGRGFDGASSALSGVATRASDFAFAQVGEFGGVVATVGVLLLFATIAWRGCTIAIQAPDRFGRLLAAGLTGVIVLQAAMHVAVNVRLFPATGVPLPFISTGGSALVVMFAAVGILQAVAAARSPGSHEAWQALRR
ncbi:MAG: FtsW/RodA/SpoVE family cell cycle protein [Dehalococcoidia bacterium]